jgi:hypothetical protein
MAVLPKATPERLSTFSDGVFAVVITCAGLGTTAARGSQSGCACSAEISTGWTRNLYLLSERLSKTRSAGDPETVNGGET